MMDRLRLWKITKYADCEISYISSDVKNDLILTACGYNPEENRKNDWRPLFIDINKKSVIYDDKAKPIKIKHDLRIVLRIGQAGY